MSDPVKAPSRREKPPQELHLPIELSSLQILRSKEDGLCGSIGRLLSWNDRESLYSFGQLKTDEHPGRPVWLQMLEQPDVQKKLSQLFGYRVSVPGTDHSTVNVELRLATSSHDTCDYGQRLPASHLKFPAIVTSEAGENVSLHQKKDKMCPLSRRTRITCVLVLLGMAVLLTLAVVIATSLYSVLQKEQAAEKESHQQINVKRLSFAPEAPVVWSSARNSSNSTFLNTAATGPLTVSDGTVPSAFSTSLTSAETQDQQVSSTGVHSRQEIASTKTTSVTAVSTELHVSTATLFLAASANSRFPFSERLGLPHILPSSFHASLSDALQGVSPTKLSSLSSQTLLPSSLSSSLTALPQTSLSASFKTSPTSIAKPLRISPFRAFKTSPTSITKPLRTSPPTIFKTSPTSIAKLPHTSPPTSFKTSPTSSARYPAKLSPGFPTEASTGLPNRSLNLSSVSPLVSSASLATLAALPSTVSPVTSETFGTLVSFPNRLFVKFTPYQASSHATFDTFTVPISRSIFDAETPTSQAISNATIPISQSISNVTAPTFHFNSNARTPTFHFSSNTSPLTSHSISNATSPFSYPISNATISIFHSIFNATTPAFHSISNGTTPAIHSISNATSPFSYPISNVRTPTFHSSSNGTTPTSHSISNGTTLTSYSISNGTTPTYRFIFNGTAPTYSISYGTTPTHSTPNGTTPTYSIFNGTTPIYSIPNGTTPIYSISNGTTPTYSISNGKTPIYSISNGTTPTYTIHNGMTPTYYISNGTTPTYSLSNVTTPSYSISNGTTPIYSISNGTTLTYSISNGTTPIYSIPNGTTPTYSISNSTTPTYSIPNGMTPTYSISNGTTPTYSLSNVTTPSYSISNGTTPTYSIPNVTTPTYYIPNGTTHTYSIPNATTPTYSIPNDTIPNATTPTYSIPNGTTPTSHSVSNGTTPIYSIPNGMTPIYSISNGTTLTYSISNGTTPTYSIHNGKTQTYSISNGTTPTYSIPNGTTPTYSISNDTTPTYSISNGTTPTSHFISLAKAASPFTTSPTKYFEFLPKSTTSSIASSITHSSSSHDTFHLESLTASVTPSALLRLYAALSSPISSSWFRSAAAASLTVPSYLDLLQSTPRTTSLTTSEMPAISHHNSFANVRNYSSSFLSPPATPPTPASLNALQSTVTTSNVTAVSIVSPASSTARPLSDPEALATYLTAHLASSLQASGTDTFPGSTIAGVTRGRPTSLLMTVPTNFSQATPVRFPTRFFISSATIPAVFSRHSAATPTLSPTLSTVFAATNPITSPTFPAIYSTASALPILYPKSSPFLSHLFSLSPPNMSSAIFPVLPTELSPTPTSLVKNPSSFVTTTPDKKQSATANRPTTAPNSSWNMTQAAVRYTDLSKARWTSAIGPLFPVSISAAASALSSWIRPTVSQKERSSQTAPQDVTATLSSSREIKSTSASEPSLRFVSSDHYYTDLAATIICEAAGVGKQNIFIIKEVVGRGGSGKLGVVGMFADGNTISLEEERISAWVEKVQEGLSVRLLASISRPTCSDSATYECLSAGMQVEQTITFKAKAPTLQVPSTIPQGKQSELICSATCSPDGGQVLWMTRKSEDDSFTRAFEGVSQDEITKRDSCGHQHRVTVTHKFDVSWNGTYVRCDVTRPATVSREVQLIVQ